MLPDQRICLHDFGMIGELDTPMRERLSRLLEATVVSDPRGVADAYVELELATGDVERLTGAVASAALIVGGPLLATIPGWRRLAGDILLAVGLLGTLAVALGAIRSKGR